MSERSESNASAGSGHGRSPREVPDWLKVRPCPECGSVALPAAAMITEFGKGVHAEVTCAECGQTYSGDSVPMALRQWNSGTDAKIIAFRKPDPKIRCGILGCGQMHLTSKSHIYRLGDETLPCCRDCWLSMGLPVEIKDVAEYRQNAEVTDAKRSVD